MSTSGTKSDVSSLGLWEILSRREPAGVPRDMDAMVLPCVVLLKTVGNMCMSRDRMAGRQAQITPTSTSIVLQYPTAT